MKPPARPSDDGSPGFAAYFHWPYCDRICPYCDFNVRRNRGVDEETWRRAFYNAIDREAARSGPRTLTSLYFGGGTPSLMSPALIRDLIERCVDRWSAAGPIEITLEANPTDAEAARFAAFAEAGVTRLSLGVQAFEDAALRFLGRNHDAAAARRALQLALATFGDVSFDLIYALPGESAGEWRQRLREALSFGAPHLSLYQLTIEAGTAFHKATERGAWAPAGEDLSADLFEISQDETSAAGLAAYEVSNHARPGFRSRHNLTYWRGGDYAGLGPGAHGRMTIDGRRRASEATRDPSVWLAREAAGDAAMAVDEPLSDEDRFAEKILMGLRSVEGVALTPAEAERLAPAAGALADQGLIEVRRERIIATAAGRQLLNAVSTALLGR